MKLPPLIIAELEKELSGLPYGKVILTVTVHAGQLRYIVSRERSICLGDKADTATPGEAKK